MGNTPTFGLPYPEGSENVSRNAIKNLADAVDTTLDNIEGTSDPSVLTLTMRTGWHSVHGPVNEPLKVYRMGRLCILQGEVYNPNGTSNTLIPYTHPTNLAPIWITTLPLGYRPAWRQRQVVIRSSTAAYAEMQIDTDGKVYIYDARYWALTPGYAFSIAYIRAADLA